MKKTIILSGLVIGIIMVLAGCKKESETLAIAPLNDYYPLEVGKMYLYRVDSTVPVNFNKQLVTVSYQAMDTIESTFTDNSGRLSYRIFRYLRDTAALQPWTFVNTFVATPSDDHVEFVENNLRFIKLQAPLRDDFSWQGNSYINTTSDNAYLEGWNYTYQNFGENYTVAGGIYDSTVTVLQQDDFAPAGPFDATLGYQQRNYSVEVYAKGVGLIYKDLLHWIWQKPENAIQGSFEDGAYGVRLSLLSHN